MKKLLFAFAGTAAFAAFAADPAAGANDISLVGFENYTVDQTVIGYGDDGQSGDSLWSCAGDDASLVKTLGGDNAAVPSITEPRPFAGETNTKYLALDTNGSELQRAIPAAGQAIAADGTYIDTLVQFTPSETAPTAADLTGAKLAIWLGVENNVTNLYVQGGYIEGPVAEGTPTIDTTATQAYKLGNIQVEPGQWYRLTVKAVKLDDDGAGNTISGFQILVDGTLAVSDTAVADAAGIQYYTDYAAEEGVFPGAAGLLSAKTLIPSCAGVQSDATLTAVGFKGTGALDDFVVTTQAPEFGPAGIDFTLTWPAGYTAVSYTIDGGAAVSLSGETSPFAVPGLAGGEAITFTFTNADGATKTMNATAADDGEIDADDAVFTWADYLGEAVNGAYEIDNLAELKLFQKGIATTTNELKLATAGETFKLTADIALDEAWPGIGVQNGKDIYSKADFNAAAFQGTFDGQNHTISGFQMIGKGDKAEGLDYCGFFNSTYGATIQNLKIAYAGSLFAADTTASTKESGATFVGVAKNSTLDNLTTVAGTVSCSKGFGGIVGYLTSGTTVQNCTNNLNMTSLAGNKCGGIAMIAQGGSAVTISNCQNNGTQTTTSSNSEYGAIVGYVGLDVTIADCETTVGRFLKHQGNTVTLQGVNKGDPTVPAYHGAATPGLNFATVDGSVATFVADAALAADNTYKVLGPSATATYEFAAAGSISFDTNMIQAVTFAITAVDGLTLTSTESAGVVTYTAAIPPAHVNVDVTGGANATAVWTVDGESAEAPRSLTEGQTWSVTLTADSGYEFDGATTYTTNGVAGATAFTIALPDATAQQSGEDWVDDVTTVTNKTAAQAYPSLAGTALATADAAQLTTWAKANSVTFASATTDANDYVEAFLLNCEPDAATVAAEKEAFKANITFNNGVPEVTTPVGKIYNGSLKLKGATSLTGSWTEVNAASSSYQFYKYELSL